MQIIYYDRTDISEGTDVNKTTKLKKCTNAIF